MQKVRDPDGRKLTPAQLTELGAAGSFMVVEGTVGAEQVIEYIKRLVHPASHPKPPKAV